MATTTTTRAVPTRRPPSRPRNWPTDQVGRPRRHPIRHGTEQPRSTAAPPVRAASHGVRTVDRGVHLGGLDRARLALVVILGCAVLAAATTSASSPNAADLRSRPTPLPAATTVESDSPRRDVAGDAAAARLPGDRLLAGPLAKLHLASGASPTGVDGDRPSTFIVNPLAGRPAASASPFSTLPAVHERVSRPASATWTR